MLVESSPLFSSILPEPPALAPPPKSPAIRHARGDRYNPPGVVWETTLGELLQGTGRSVPEAKQQRLAYDVVGARTRLWCAGDPLLVVQRCVAIVGSRKVSQEGAARARRLARAMADAGVVVVSGLAVGVDTEAMRSAIGGGGRTIGVIGTPLTKAYPAANKRLQEQVYQDHLLVSQFPDGAIVNVGNFPARNRLMATLSDATVIIEAGDTSGALHQAAACKDRGRWLFIAKAVAEDPALKWPRSFLGAYERARVLADADDVLKVLPVR